MGLLTDKFCQISKEYSARDTPIFSFPGDNFCKCQGILTKFGTCINIKEIRFEISNGQISSMFARDTIMAGYFSLFFFLFLFFFFFFVVVVVVVVCCFFVREGGAR